MCDAYSRVLIVHVSRLQTQNAATTQAIHGARRAVFSITNYHPTIKPGQRFEVQWTSQQLIKAALYAACSWAVTLPRWLSVSSIKQDVQGQQRLVRILLPPESRLSVLVGGRY